ncbi:hypothetical protein Psfp_03807 [Pelotomaculum sp. FP]|uniref:hypothetical protein n=1 Tax=Pelotomaculum sp. FP TaxID=261474 RepID=UPI001064A51F|nr:hypothetical protein [Pelotomaculum sp. FP]TEB12174.1 hypothetical protein Psfp_03807 [Pelotomaculum sp. FP]
MFKIDVVDNIKLSLDLTIDSFEQIHRDNDNVKSYKLAIINLHSAFELTFKFMILNRNEFMLFSYGSNGFNNVLNKYKRAKECNYNSLLNYLEDNPSEVHPNTVSFGVAYQILAYMYNITEFDERFIFELTALEILRNKLTHFEATVYRIDFILMTSLFRKYVELLNKEIQEYNNSWRFGNNKYETYKYDFNKLFSYGEICMKLVKDDILNKPKYKLILGVVLDESCCEMIEVEPNEYGKLAEICYKKRKAEFNNLYTGKKEKEIKVIIMQDIYLLLEANILYLGYMYDSRDVPVMGRTTLTPFAIHAINEKWSSSSDICRELVIKSEGDIYATFNYIQNIETNYCGEDWRADAD